MTEEYCKKLTDQHIIPFLECASNLGAVRMCELADFLKAAPASDWAAETPEKARWLTARKHALSILQRVGTAFAKEHTYEQTMLAVEHVVEVSKETSPENE